MITLQFPKFKSNPERNLLIVTGYETPHVFENALSISEAKSEYIAMPGFSGGIVPPFAIDESGILYDAWTEERLNHIRDGSYFKNAKSDLEFSSYFDS